MALDGAGYAPSEFKLALKAESTIGTENVSSMNLINVTPFHSLHLIRLRYWM